MKLRLTPWIWGVVLAPLGCGTPGLNVMLSPKSSLASIGAPHEDVLVKTSRGLLRVYLDTAATEVVDDHVDTTWVGNGVSIHSDNGQYVIRHPDRAIVVAGVVAAGRRLELSPDRALF